MINDYSKMKKNKHPNTPPPIRFYLLNTVKCNNNVYTSMYAIMHGIPLYSSAPE